MMQRSAWWQKMAEVKAITFDAVGTLITTELSVGEVYAEELARLQIHLSPQLLEERFRHAFSQFKHHQPESVLGRSSWQQIVRATLEGLAPAEGFEEQFALLWQAFAGPERWQILPGVETALQQLCNEGMRLFVLSNNDGRLHGVIAGLGLMEYFETVFVSAELGAEKPSPKIFREVERRIGVVPPHTLHVGDTPREDVEGAVNAGWSAALISSSGDRLSGMAEAVAEADSVCSLFYRAPS